MDRHLAWMLLGNKQNKRDVLSVITLSVSILPLSSGIPKEGGKIEIFVLKSELRNMTFKEHSKCVADFVI